MRLDFGMSNLIPAVHTPFDQQGELNLDLVEKQAEHLLAHGLSTIFVAGTTGECTSLTVPERLALAERWFEVARQSPIKIIVHVGTNCLKDSQELAGHAQRHGALAISAFAPSYFKFTTVESLSTWCSQIIASASVTPFFLYDIPSLTQVKLNVPSFLIQSIDTLPTLAGVKFSHSDLVTLQLCQAIEPNKYEVLFGVDEMLLSALVLGVRGGVGSTYNFAAPLYHKLMKAFADNDLPTARQLQLRSVRLVQILASRGFMASAKALLTFQGVDVGPPRLPHDPLTDTQRKELYHDLLNEHFL